MHRFGRECWTAAIYASMWCAFDWLTGGTTTLRMFAGWMVLCGIALWCALAIGDWFQARAAQREYREVKEMERQVRARYSEMTGQQWPD